MKYQCQITLPYSKALFDALNPEKGSSKRAAWELFKKQDKMLAEFTASDAIALRAIVNSFTKLLSVWEAVENGLTQRRSR